MTATDTTGAGGVGNVSSPVGNSVTVQNGDITPPGAPTSVYHQ
ncbi:MAG: hypothetical protein WDN27_03765 [Candidatus Saccharibacteria bacterium]